MGKLAFFVILLDEIEENCSTLPECEASVRVINGGDASIGVDVDVRWVFDIGEADGVDLVRDSELF